MGRKEKFFAFIESKRAELDRLGLESIGLFGSTVRGEERPESDLDVLVKFQSGRKTLDNFLQISEILEDFFGCEVDLMTPESLSRHFGPRILSEAEYVEIAS
jgi:predicted nucleotidyltransferase